MAGLLLMLPVIVNTVLQGVIAIVFAGPSRGVSASLPLMVAAAVAGAGLALGWLLLSLSGLGARPGGRSGERIPAMGIFHPQRLGRGPNSGPAQPAGQTPGGARF